jgi:hypothetical protein
VTRGTALPDAGNGDDFDGVNKALAVDGCDPLGLLHKRNRRTYISAANLG